MRDPDDPVVMSPYGRPPIEGDRMPCKWCGTPTSRATLNTYGARCFHCYERYCEEPNPAPSHMADKRVVGPKGWAHALKAREDDGERLSTAQRDMWRAAIGSQG